MKILNSIAILASLAAITSTNADEFINDEIMMPDESSNDGMTMPLAVATPRRPIINGCTMDDLAVFNSISAEFMDKLSRASEETLLSVDLADDPEQARIDFPTNPELLPMADQFRDYVIANAADDFNFDLTLINRNILNNAPFFSHNYASIDDFFSGTYVDGELVLPGFYSALAINEGRFLNPNGGGSGYSHCLADGTAETIIRSIDAFASVTLDVEPQDGILDSEFTIARLTVNWSQSDNDDGMWVMNKFTIMVERLGYLSF